MSAQLQQWLLTWQPLFLCSVQDCTNLNLTNNHAITSFFSPTPPTRSSTELPPSYNDSKQQLMTTATYALTYVSPLPSRARRISRLPLWGKCGSVIIE